MGTLDGLPPLRDVINRHGLDARKALGQNFLLDLNLTQKIARTAGSLDGVTVFEVGPGPGGLTRAILALGAKKVIAVERDSRCLPALAEISDFYPGRLEVIEGDALKTDFAALAPEGPVKIIANLPYNVGTQLLINWLLPQQWPPFWESLTLMFQKEVAERIVATPKERADYGRLEAEGREQFEGIGVYYAATALEGQLCRNEAVHPAVGQFRIDGRKATSALLSGIDESADHRRLPRSSSALRILTTTAVQSARFSVGRRRFVTPISSALIISAVDDGSKVTSARPSSRNTGMSLAAIGAPSDRASSNGRPNPSSSEGKTKNAQFSYIQRSSGSVREPMKCMRLLSPL